MRKIAILVPDLNLGGGQRVAMNMAEMLASAGDEVQIVTMSNEDSHFETNLPIVSLNCIKRHSFTGKLLTIFQRVKAFKALLKKEQFDVVISFLESANLCAFLSDRKKSILTIHGNPTILTNFDRMMLKNILRHSNNIVSVSDGLKDILEYSYDLKNVSVIKNSTDPNEIQAKAKLGNFEHPRKFIVAAGRLTEVKQFDVMIDAYFKSKARKDYDLIIIGDGEKRCELEAKITENKDNDGTVILAGQQSNPFPIFQASQFYLMSSETEAFPMVLLEALSLGKPIVAYNCPTGVKEIVEDNFNGLLVENQNTTKLVEAIDTIVYEEGKLESLAAKSVEPVESFTPQSINKQWQSYFDQMTKNN